MDPLLLPAEEAEIAEIADAAWCDISNIGTKHAIYDNVTDAYMDMLRRAFRKGQVSMLPPIDIQQVVERIQKDAEK